MDSVEYYVSDGYNEINAAMRSGVTTPEIRKHITNIIQEIDAKGVVSDVYATYKFTDWEGYKTCQIGDVITDAGFFSQSDDKHAAERSASSPSMGVLLCLKWDKLPKALFLEEEDEILTYPGVELTIIDIKQRPAFRLVKATVRSTYRTDLWKF